MSGQQTLAEPTLQPAVGRRHSREQDQQALPAWSLHLAGRHLENGKTTR